MSMNDASDMLNVTSAVRSVGAANEGNERKYGQQKWGLFET